MYDIATPILQNISIIVGMKSQGKFLVKMISLSISLLDDEEKFNDTITKLTEVHNDRGVKAVEYGKINGDIFANNILFRLLIHLCMYI